MSGHSAFYRLCFRPTQTNSILRTVVSNRLCGVTLRRSYCAALPTQCARLIERRTVPFRICNCHFGIRSLHVSSRRTAAPLPFAVLAVAARKALKLVAAVFGREGGNDDFRAFRKWYMALPPDKQRRLYVWVTARRAYFAAGGLSMCGLSAAYYYSHLEETPMTGRRRFVTLTKHQQDKVARFEADGVLLANRDKILPSNDPRVRYVERVVDAIVAGNSDLEGIRAIPWKVHLVLEKDRNAFIVPTGDIFVFKGIMNTLENADQLGIVLSHEMAHALLGHGVEKLSWSRFLDWFIIVSFGAIWVLMPGDSVAVFATWFYNFLVNTVAELPYSRTLELEADEVGLLLAARSCIDVREAYAYWENMNSYSKVGIIESQPPDVVSTHPNHGDRASRLEKLIPEMLKVRSECKCPQLPRVDPRVKADILGRKVDAQLAVEQLRPNRYG